MAKGGKRPGAGRKKGFKAIAAEKAREFVVKTVSENLEPILTAQMEAAKGLYYEKKTEDGEILVFQEKPDINAGKYLIDQTIGKATESLEVGGPDGSPIEYKEIGKMTAEEVNEYLKSKLNESTQG